MMDIRLRKGRLRPLLYFLVAFVAVLLVAVGVAWAGTGDSLPIAAEALSSAITITADGSAGFEDVTPTVTAPSALVLNMDTAEVLWEKAPDAERAMASTTKMMTAVIVLEEMDLSAQVTVSERAASTWELETWTKAGDVFTVEQLLYSLMVPSHNQAAVALAEAYPGGAAAFVQRMNAKAAELGMTGTNYTNPTGLDAPGHHSTATDLATLARYALTNERVGPTFRELVQTREYSLENPSQAGTLVFRNSNELLSMYEWVVGVKTGETPDAKSCLVSAGTRDGVTILCVVLGADPHEVVFTESLALLEYGFSQYHYVTVLDEGAVIARASIPHEEEPLDIIASDKVGMELAKGQSLTATVVIDRILRLPVEAGVVVGRVELAVDGQAAVGSVDLVTARAVNKLTLGSKIARFFSGLF